jgi:hypothetical protein
MILVMNIVDFINEMGDNDLLCNPHARNTAKQQKITSGIFHELKSFREKYLRDATHEEFQQIGEKVEKSYKREMLKKRRTTFTKRLVAAI